MKNIFLKDTRVAMVTCAFHPEQSSERRPAVAIYTDLTQLGRDSAEAEGSVLLGFLIKSVEPVSDDPMNPMVLVTFETTNGDFSFRMPVQYFSVAHRLSTLGDGIGGVPMFLVDSRGADPINPARSLFITDMSYVLMFRKPETDEAGEIQDSMSALIHDSVASPGPDADWDDVESEETSLAPEFQFALSKLMNASLSLSRGDIAPMFTVPEMFDETSENEPRLHPQVYISVLGHTLDMIQQSSPATRSAYDADGAGPSEENAYDNFRFNHLLESTGLAESMSEIAKSIDISEDDEHILWAKQVGKWNASAKDSWPEAMEPVRAYLEESGTLDDVHKIIDSKPSSMEDYLGLMEEYGNALTVIALCISIAHKAYLRVEFIDTDDELLTPQGAVIASFRQHEEPRWWELESVIDELAAYNTANAADIAMFGSRKMGDNVALPYLIPLLASIGVHMMEDDHFAALDADGMAEQFSGLSFRGREYAEFESFILRYRRKIDETIDELEEPVESAAPIALHAVASMLEPGMDFHRLSSVVALSFPMFAEMKANSEFEKWSDDWENRRYSAVVQMAQEIADVIRNATVENG